MLIFPFESQTDKYAYVQIPKNASSTLGNEFFPRNKIPSFRLHEIDLSNHTLIIILRDPITRWFAGLAEDYLIETRKFKRWKSIEDCWSTACSQYQIGTHTRTQISHINEVKSSSIQYFVLDENFDHRFEKWMRAKGFGQLDYTSLYKHVNKRTDCNDRANAVAWFKQQYNNEIEKGVRNFYRQDFDLYNYYSKLNVSVDRDLNKLYNAT